MRYVVEVFEEIWEYKSFLDNNPNINIVSVNITNYVYNGLQTRIYLTYFEEKDIDECI